MITKREERFVARIAMAQQAKEAWSTWIPPRPKKIPNRWASRTDEQINKRLRNKAKGYVNHANDLNHNPITFFSVYSSRRQRPSFWDRAYEYRIYHGKRIPYAVFLKSTYWKRVREKVFKYYGYRCHKCSSTTSVRVHHPNYHFVRRELETGRWRELIPLCKSCHDQEHGIITAHQDGPLPQGAIPISSQDCNRLATR